MTLVERLYPTFVSFLGSLGLGTALAFLFWGTYFYATDNTLWLQIFLYWGPLLVLVPFGALVAHLYLRTHLAGWYLEHGRIEKAAGYAGERLDHSLLRSRREALVHRMYLGRAQIARGEYAEALATLTRGFSEPEAETLLARYRRWQLEAALRLEDDEMADEALEGALEMEADTETRANLRACAAECAVLEGNCEAYHTHLDEARWLKSARARADFVEALGTARFGKTAEARETALQCIRRSRTASQTEVPGRAGEWYALRTELLVDLDRMSEAERTLDEAEEARADDRSELALERARKRLDDQSS